MLVCVAGKKWLGSNVRADSSKAVSCVIGFFAVWNEGGSRCGCVKM